MSEYQYYEFRAVDRPLSRDDQLDIRRVSSRARITDRSFVNHYDFGDFKGDTWEFMERWFDLHVYVANWGTRRLMIRLPKGSIPQGTLDRLIMSVDEFEYRHAGNHLIISVTQHVGDIADDDWLLDDDAYLTALAPLRDDLMRGDLRMLYLVWLIGFAYEAYDKDAEEPLSGVGPLSPALTAFADFFMIDRALLTAAAEYPATLAAPVSPSRAKQIVAALSDKEKTDYLLRLLKNDPTASHALNALVRERAEPAKSPPPTAFVPLAS
ncbi:MAG: hypothetical protein QM753_12260 [Thermomicrobiales bacterium]